MKEILQYWIETTTLALSVDEWKILSLIAQEMPWGTSSGFVELSDSSLFLTHYSYINLFKWSEQRRNNWDRCKRLFTETVGHQGSYVKIGLLVRRLPKTPIIEWQKISLTSTWLMLPLAQAHSDSNPIVGAIVLGGHE